MVTLDPLYKLGRRSCVTPFGCVEWGGNKNNKGYGRIGHEGKMWLVHRLSWYLVHEVEPDGQLDHVCRNKLCWNAEHLELVTNQENARRRYRVKARCNNGHVFTATSFYSTGGRIVCKPCQAARAAKWWKDKRRN